MRWLAAVGLCAAGCGFEHGVVAGDDGGVGGDGPSGAEIDAPPDAFDPNCFGKAPFTVCLQNPPAAAVILPMRIDTDSTGMGNCLSLGGEIATVAGAESCVIAGISVTAGGAIVGVSGARPLVIVATDTINVTTTNFDITSNSTTGDGPNANPADCAPIPSMNGGSSNAGDGAGGGGAGGTFGSRGGDGGTAGNNVAGGVAKPAAMSFDKLRGGCRGGSGDGPEETATGGSGGGALYLVARNAITITGVINASGAGGRGAEEGPGGGGGGGSGGMIVLHAPTLSIGAAGRVFANGGGGGGGAGESADGGRGGDGLTAETAALGGVALSAQATAGGTGAFKSTAAGSALGATEGGGGGGGGVGVIRILSGQSVAPLNVSPTPILN